MRSFLAATIVLLSLVPGYAGSAEASPGPSKDVPELQPLNHYVGKWVTGMTIKPNTDMPNGARTTGVATGEWIHDGRFLRQTWASEANAGLPAMSGTTIMTFDPRKRIYRSWSFYSTGFLAESRGSWDSNSKTMTWTFRDGDSGGSAVTKARFAEEGIENWSITEQDGTGKVRSEITGKNTRRKE